MPQFYYIKVGFKGGGIKMIFACFRDRVQADIEDSD